MIGVPGKAALALAALLVILLTVSAGGRAEAQTPEFRAYWVDAWHNGFFNASQCDQLIIDMHASNCNVAVVQMRRRGDTFYPSQIEPFATELAPTADPSFDALRYLLDHCHAANPPIQVHAWLVLLPAWTGDPLPTNPDHPINKYPQYLTKNSGGGTVRTFDPGHPDCEEYLNSIVMELVNNYPDLDGVSYDYSRFGSADEGYNDASVQRFNQRYNRTGTPATTDPAWSQWRRDQITNLIRKTYANATAVNPNICMSSAVVTWHPDPAEVGSFEATRPYKDVFQDWRAWMQEGILDISMPMAYFDVDESHAGDYNAWSDFAVMNQFNRGTAIGPGIYMNNIDDSIAQIRRTRVPVAGSLPKGVILYSYATTNEDGIPNSTFYNALSHPSAYDPDPTPLFGTPVSVPLMPWKSSPTKGHIRGTVVDCGLKLDGLVVTASGPETRSMYTDGTGFYALIDVSPGSYTVSCTYRGATINQPVTVSVGQVATADLDFCGTDPTPPVITNVELDSVGYNQARITWTTDDPSTSQVQYGPTISYGQATAEDTNLVTSHSVLIQGLTHNSTYHFRARSSNATPLTSYSHDGAFVTLYQAQPLEIIVDNTDATFTETPPDYVWSTGTGGGCWGTNYRYVANNKSTSNASCTWRPNITVPGSYDVYVWYPSGSGRTPSARYTVTYSGGASTGTITVDQTQNQGQWVKIADALPFDAGTAGFVRLNNRTNENSKTRTVAADAVRLVYRDTGGPSVPENLQVTSVSTTEISLSWSASSDNFGVIGYKVFRDGACVGNPAVTSFTDTGLQANSSHTYTVTSYDGANNESAQSSPVTRYTLSTPPTAQSLICDRIAGVWYNTTPFTFTNNGFGAGKVNYYRCAWDSSPTHAWDDTEYVWASGAAQMQADATSPTWYLHVRGYNGDWVPNGSMDIGPFRYDSVSPTMSQVTAPWYVAIRGQSFDDLSASWLGVDSHSGVAEYLYAVGTSPGAADILTWTSSGAATSASCHYPGALQHSYSYYWTVKARDYAGNWGPELSSHWSIYANAFDTLAAAMNNPDGTPVIITSEKTVTADFGSYAYIQEPGRSRGLRVAHEGGTWQPGNLVLVAGKLGRANGERQMAETQQTLMGISAGSPAPLAMTVAAVGGTSPDPYTPGLAGSAGCYNVGLLVRTAGRVTAKGSGYFTMSDGSTAVKVYSAVAPPDNAFVGVTGISSAEAGARAIRARSEADVQVFAQ